MRNTTHLIVLRDLLHIIEQLRPIVKTIRSHDRELAEQLRDAASSAALNLGEGAGSSGGTRRARYETSLGSTQETRVALQVAAAWGFDLAAVETVDDATFAGWVEGTPVRARPLLVKDGAGAIFLVDDDQEDGAATGGSSADDGGEGGSADDAGPAGDSTDSGVDDSLPDGFGEGEGGGCGCRARGRKVGALALFVLVACVRSRRGKLAP